MCGLITILDWKAGVWGTQTQATRAVQRGMQAMAYRGLAGRHGMEIVGRTVLGHVRLPIVDLSEEADQPLLVDGVFVTFTGEIFNFKDLFPEARNDTEALALAFRKAGLDAFHRFDGFWAATLVTAEEVIIVTDYLSQKPLYFHEDSLLVASEPEAIIAALDYRPNRDPVYFSNVLKWGYDPTGRTPHQRIRQLSAGEALVWNRKDRTTTRVAYWDWEKFPPGDLRELLVNATRNRMLGDREVGLLLSGGLDSTIIFKILTEVLQQPVEVFHIENQEEEFLEAALGNRKSYALRPPEVTVPEAVKAHQVPVDLGSMVPQFALAKAIRKSGLYVVMSGDGADELFGGYRRARDYDSQASDTFMELPYYHHPRLDRLMMRETIELRSPYLSPRVVRYSMGLPWKFRREKEQLKHTFKDLVPHRILERPKHPLKTVDVINGGVEYRRLLIDLWENEFHD